MLLTIEIIFLFAGIWALVAGKLPSFLFGGPKYRLEGGRVRLLGVILMLPIPIALVGGVVIGLLFGEQAEAYAMLFEIVAVLGVGIVAVIVGRLIRRPLVEAEGEQATQEAEEAEIEAEIGRKVQGSFIYLLLSGLGFTSIVVCPLAYIRTTKALRMIEEHGVGERYRGAAKIVRVLSAAVLLFWIVVVICIVALALGGGL
jgi:flagellar basal body-associated protein FliL